MLMDHAMPSLPETCDSPVVRRRPAKPQKLHPYPIWSPRFWHGMRFGDWIGLLVENRFRIHPARWAMVCLISMITPFSTVMSRVQRLLYGRRIDATELEHPPLFIIGHWRSGTTFLHELMVLDDRFTYPTTYQCFAPYHFLLTEWFLARYCGFLLPRKRPMDNMLAGWQRPQEDEFALLTMGQRTPYRRMAFPNRAAVDLDYLNMQGIPPERLRDWSQSLISFVRTITFRYPKRVILKSPTHTGRVKLLSEMFPARSSSTSRVILMPCSRRLGACGSLLMPSRVASFRKTNIWMNTSSSHCAACTMDWSRSVTNSTRHRSSIFAMRTWWPTRWELSDASISSLTWVISRR